MDRNRPRAEYSTQPESPQAQQEDAANTSVSNRIQMQRQHSGRRLRKDAEYRESLILEGMQKI